MKKRDATHSLYGAGHVNATRVRECVAMPGVRNQVICSPQCVVDGLRRLWPQGVAYDPCSAAASVVGAARATETRGLIDPWPDRTYCNPPYGKSLFYPEQQADLWALEHTIRDRARELGEKPNFPEGLPLKTANLSDWLEMQLVESLGESVMLVPNRTNRKWLRRWRQSVAALVELDPIAFLDQKHAFPSPLVLGFVGPRDRRNDFYEAFGHIGDQA